MLVLRIGIITVMNEWFIVWSFKRLENRTTTYSVRLYVKILYHFLHAYVISRFKISNNQNRVRWQTYKLETILDRTERTTASIPKENSMEIVINTVETLFS